VRAVGIVALIVGVPLTLGACAGPEHRGEVTSVVAGPADAVLVTVVDGSARTTWSVNTAGAIVGGASPTTVAAATQACAGDVCFRVVPGRLAVERSVDRGGRFRTDWDVAGAAYQRLASEYPDLGDPAVHLSSVAVVMLPAPTTERGTRETEAPNAAPVATGGPGDRHVVFVANGRDGLLLRTADGRWRRLGVPQRGSTPYFVPSPALRPGVGIAGQVAAATGGIVLLAAGWTIARRRTVRPARAAAAAGIAVLIGVTGYFASGLPDLDEVPAIAYATLIVIAATVGGTAMAVFILTGPERSSR
jgi:hypothetical protein